VTKLNNIRAVPIAPRAMPTAEVIAGQPPLRRLRAASPNPIAARPTVDTMYPRPSLKSSGRTKIVAAATAPQKRASNASGQGEARRSLRVYATDRVREGVRDGGSVGAQSRGPGVCGCNRFPRSARHSKLSNPYYQSTRNRSRPQLGHTSFVGCSPRRLARTNATLAVESIRRS
jgi:hypothetical protein